MEPRESLPLYRRVDFSSEPYLQHLLTGEIVPVYGPGSTFDGGPFRLEVETEEGRECPILTGLAGDEETCALHDASDVFTMQVARAPREGHAEPQWQLSQPVEMGGVEVRRYL